MKIDSKKFYTAIESVSGLIRPRNQNPMASYMLITAGGKGVKLTATNIDESATELVSAETKGSFSCCLDAERLKAAVAFAKEFVEIECDEKHLKVDAGAKCLIPIHPGDEFPAGLSENLKKCDISCPDLATGISAVSSFAMKNESRPIMKSVHVKPFLKDCLCEASDGMNGAYYQFPNQGGISFIAASEFVKRLVPALQRTGTVLSMNERFISVEFEGGSYWCKQLEGKYPETDMVRTSEDYKPNIALGEINASELASTLRLAVAMNGQVDKMPVAVLTFSDSGISIEGNNFNRTISGKFSDFEVSVNARSLAECLSAFSGSVKLETGKLKFVHMSSGNLSAFSMPLRS